MAFSSLASSASTVPAHVYFGEPSPGGEDEPDLHRVPARALMANSRHQISRYLDPDLAKNWRFLAEELNYEMLDIENWQRMPSPTSSLLQNWTSREGSTIGRLLEKLRLIERDDVITDCRNLFVQDAKRWIRKRTTPVQVPEVTTVSVPDEDHQLTLSDRADQIETFDAYVCYCQEDMGFVNELMNVLEEKYKLKLFIESRDLLPGVCSTSAMAELIKNRCKRMLVILSPSFHQNELNNFCIKYGISLQPSGYSKRVIPIIVSPCTIPPILTHLTALDYTKSNLRQWFWGRLNAAINRPL